MGKILDSYRFRDQGAAASLARSAPGIRIIAATELLPSLKFLHTS